MIETGTYELKAEFFPLLRINKKQYERRKDDLLMWFNNFFNYELKEGKPIIIIIKDVYDEYKPLPRRMPSQEELNREKIRDYEIFTMRSLGHEFKPNSKTRVAREAISKFGREKYGHHSATTVARNYIGPAFDKYGVTNNEQVWVDYRTYKPLPIGLVTNWRNMLEQENLSEESAANAFFRFAQGENVDQEVSYYQKAQQRFMQEFGTIPVLVKEWKLK